MCTKNKHIARSKRQYKTQKNVFAHFKQFRSRAELRRLGLIKQNNTDNPCNSGNECQ